MLPAQISNGTLSNEGSDGAFGLSRRGGNVQAGGRGKKNKIKNETTQRPRPGERLRKEKQKAQMHLLLLIQEVDLADPSPCPSEGEKRVRRVRTSCRPLPCPSPRPLPTAVHALVYLRLTGARKSGKRLDGDLCAAVERDGARHAQIERVSMTRHSLCRQRHTPPTPCFPPLLRCPSLPPTPLTKAATFPLAIRTSLSSGSSSTASAVLHGGGGDRRERER